MVPVINPKHERDLLVLGLPPSENRNLSKNGLHFSCGMSMVPNNLIEQANASNLVKTAFASYVDKWFPGSVGPDGTYGFDTGTFDLCGADSLLLSPADRPRCAIKNVQIVRASSPDYLLMGGSATSAKLRDILKHKVIIFFKVTLRKTFDFGSKDGMPNQFLKQGILSGNNYWSMMRSPFQLTNPVGRTTVAELTPYLYGISTTTTKGLPGGENTPYADLFGIQGGFESTWWGMAVSRGTHQTIPEAELLQPVRSEDFIGAEPSELVSSAEFPPLSVDPVRLKNMLTWMDTTANGGCPEDKGIVGHYPYMDSLAALPDVGFTIPTTSAGTETLYLYKSRLGEAKFPYWPLSFGDMQGTVVAVRRDGGFFRTSHWQFTPLTLEQNSFQPAFNTMMNWLFARPWGGPSFGTAPNPAPPVSGKYASEYIRLAKSVESDRQDMLKEAFGGKRFKNQLEFEGQLKDFLKRKRLEAEIENQSY